MEYQTNSAQETQKIAREFVEKLSPKEDGALVVGISGDLGAGKTTFIQGLAGSLGVEEKILSPTFVIMKRFEIGGGKFANLYHFDFYRLETEKDLQGMDFEEIMSGPRNLVLIEWAEKLKNVLPKDAIWIKFEHGGEDKRKIIFNFQ